MAPPTQADYDKAKRIALFETLQSAPVLLVSGGGILGGVACGLLAITSPIAAVGIGVAGLVTGGGLWLATLARNGDAIQGKYREALHKQFDEMRIARLRELERVLGEQFDCPQGKNQVGEFGEKFETLVEILKKKLSTHELTYSRFVTNAELICSSGIKNLEKVTDLLTSIRTIEIADVRRRIAKFERSATPMSSSGKREYEALKTSAKIYEEVETKVADLLAQNEESLTVLEQAAVAASQIQNDSVSEMELAMKELLHIASRQVTAKTADLL